MINALKKVFNNASMILPDRTSIKIKFKYHMGNVPNLSNPRTYNEKLQWLKLHDRKPEYNIYVDKFEVRSYIKKTIGEKYLIPLIGVYNNVEEIKWNELPEKFVLKCTHGSKSNIICTNKAELDIDDCIKKLKQWMKRNWFWVGREWPYKDVKPRIICEQFIETRDGKPPIDYKFMCFNGEPKLIQVHLDRFGSSYTKDYYDINWNKTTIRQGVNNSNIIVPRPKQLEAMLEIAKTLSKNLPFARIDLYENNGNIYFGEITLYPNSGFTKFDNYNDDLLLGSWIKLPID